MIPAPVLTLAALSLAGFFAAFGLAGWKSALMLATGNLILFAWASRKKAYAQHWLTALIAAAPILALSIACFYIFRIMNADALASLAIRAYFLLHSVLLPVSLGIARTYHDTSVPGRA